MLAERLHLSRGMRPTLAAVDLRELRKEAKLWDVD
jgi:hypothetical protein